MPESGRKSGDNARVLWTPPKDVREITAVGRYLEELRRTRGLEFETYLQLWTWSVTDLEDFWSSVWDWLEVVARTPRHAVLSDRRMPGAKWFPGATLNYAEHALRGAATDRPAILARSQTRSGDVAWSGAELADRVARIAAGLRRRGVVQGDRVVAWMPNIPETVALLLATASLGAVFSSCAPEFGPRAVAERVRQIEPKVLVAVDGYRYGARAID